MLARQRRAEGPDEEVFGTLARAAATIALALGIVTAPTSPEAQSGGKRLPRIGYLSASESSSDEAFRQGLRELGYVDGQNIAIEYRFAQGNYEQLSELATGLVRLDVAVIVTATTPAIRAAQRATQTIPIVMTVGEPAEGTIVSLAHPAGNITGVSTINTELSGKRLELARALGVQLQLLGVKIPSDFEGAFDAARRGRADALMGLPDQMLTTHRQRLGDLALRHQLPTMYWSAIHPESGNLMSYGPNVSEMFRRAATYVDRILRGAKAGDLPVEQPTKFVFVINLKTARALGLTIPQSLVLRADRVIE